MSNRKGEQGILEEELTDGHSFKIIKGQSRLYQLKSNKVKENKTIWFLRTLLGGIFYFFVEPANLFYLVASLVMIIGGTTISMYNGNLYLILLAGLLLIRLVIFFIYEKKRFNTSNGILQKEVLRSTKASLKGTKIHKSNLLLDKLVKGEDICVGDIIRFKKYDIVPCDCIVLGTSDEKNGVYVCSVDNTLSQGLLAREEKVSSRLTQPFTHLCQTTTSRSARKFIKRISGKVVVYPYDRIRNQFRGTIKLKSDPQVEELSNSNLLMRGSIIRSKFVYGLVVLTGNSASTIKDQFIKRGKRSSIHKTVTVYSTFAIILNLIFSLLSILTLFVRTQDNEVLKKIDTNLANGIRIFTFLILYAPVVSITMLVMIEISNVIYASRMEKKYKNFLDKSEYRDFISSQGKKGKTEEKKAKRAAPGLMKLNTNVEAKSISNKKTDSDNSFKIFNANVLPDLGCADHIFFDKTGTLVIPDYEIMTVATSTKMYKSEGNNFMSEDIVKEVKAAETNMFLENNEPNNSSVFEEGSRRSNVMNPNYNFTIKIGTEGQAAEHFSSLSSGHRGTETENLINSPNGYHANKVNAPSVKLFNDHKRTTEQNSAKSDLKNGKVKAVAQARKKINPSPFAPSKDKKKNILHKIYDEYDFFKDTIKDKEVQDMMKMFTLCHNSGYFEDKFESSSFEEKAMLVFSKNFNYTFEDRKIDSKKQSDAQTLKYLYLKSPKDKKRKEFNVLLVNEMDKRNRFSVLIENPRKKTATLYVRGTDTSMSNLLHFNDHNSKSYNEVVKYNTICGLRSYVFAKKVLTEDEKDEYVKEFYNIKFKVLDKRVNFAKLATRMEKGFEFICVAGFKNKYRGEAIAVINNLKNMGVKVSMLTGDEFEHARMTANLVKMINFEQNYEIVHFEDLESGMANIKGILEKMKKIAVPKKRRDTPISKAKTSVSHTQLKEINKSIIMFSGTAWNVIRKSSYLSSHFMFICQFAQSIIGYGLSSLNKKEFVGTFRESNSNQSKRLICVGDGFNDIGMLKEANVGIQIRNRLVDVVFGDIYIDNLAVIPVMMRREGRTLHSNLKQTIFIFFGQSFGVLFIAFFYQFYCSFTGTPIINSALLFLNYILIFIQGLFFVMAETKFSPKMNDMYPSFYMQKIYTSRNDLKSLFYELILTMGESVWILFFTVFAYYDQRNRRGELGNTHMISLSISLSNQFLTSLKFAIRSKNATIKMLLFTLFFGILMMSLVSFLNGAVFLDTAFDIAGFEIYSHYNALFTMVSSMTFSSLFTWIMWELAFRKMRFPILCDIEKRVRDFGSLLGGLGNINQKYLDIANKNESFSSIVSHSFTNNEKMDFIIENILSSMGSSESINIEKSSLKFQTAILEKKYQIFSLKRFLKITRLQILGGLVTMVLLTLFVLTADGDIKNRTQARLTNFVYIILMALVFVLSITKIFRNHVSISMSVLMVMAIGGGAFNSVINETDYTLIYVLILIFITTNYNLTYTSVRIIAVLQFIVYIVISIYNYLEIYEGYLWPKDSKPIDKIYAFGSLLLLGVLMMILTIVQRYKNEKLIKNEFKAGNYLQNKSKITKELLSMLLPKFVLDKLDNFDVGDYKIGEDVGEVTVIFCDIADFDKVIKEKEDDIVRILDNLFRKFDEFCLTHGLQKIETVGKTYMAAGGLKYVEDLLPSSTKIKNPTVRVLDFAKDMMTEIKNFEGLNLKIGIHSGECMMGVIGYHKPQFSLIGDTVNTTARHCTTGKAGHIMVSQEAWAHIKENSAKTNGYTFKIIPAFMKGKGDVDVYHIYPKKRTFVSRLQKALKRGGNSNYLDSISGNQQMQSEFKILKSVFAEDRKKAFAPDFGKLGDIIDQVKKNMTMLQQLQLGTNDKKKTKTKSKGKAKGQIEKQFEDDVSDEFELSSTDDEEELLKPNILLKFKNSEQHIVKKFLESMSKANHSYLRVFNVILLIQNIFQTLMYTTSKRSVTSSSKDEANYFVAVAIRSLDVGIIIFMIFYNSGFYSKTGRILYMGLYFFISASYVLQMYLLDGAERLYYSHIIVVELIFTFICGIQCGLLDFVDSCVYFYFQLILYIVFYSIKLRQSATLNIRSLYEYVSLFLISGFFSLLNNYIYMKTEIDGFNSESQSTKRVEDMNDFIERLLPKHVVKTLGMAQENKGEKHENVTLLYADIVGFTAYSASHTSQEVVDLIYNLFTAFDKECSRLNLYKVYTIGDCYVVMSFTDSDDRKEKPEEEAFDVLQLAFKMIDIIAQTREAVNFDKLKMRVGIHTGEIIGGVVGTGIIRFDLYGQDVSIANTMESKGIPDKIKVSAASKLLIEKYFEDIGYDPHIVFEKQKDVYMKKLNRSIENYIVVKEQRLWQPTK